MHSLQTRKYVAATRLGRCDGQAQRDTLAAPVLFRRAQHAEPPRARELLRRRGARGHELRYYGMLTVLQAVGTIKMAAELDTTSIGELGKLLASLRQQISMQDPGS